MRNRIITIALLAMLITACAQLNEVAIDYRILDKAEENTTTNEFEYRYFPSNGNKSDKIL